MDSFFALSGAIIDLICLVLLSPAQPGGSGMSELVSSFVRDALLFQTIFFFFLQSFVCLFPSEILRRFSS